MKYMKTMKMFETIAEVTDLVGTVVATSDWLTITQEQVNLFAQATGDHQWIHVDLEKARNGPFYAPIAQGFLTLSLIPRFLETSLKIAETRLGVNYGLNRVRFTSPVVVGSRIRAHFKLLKSEPIDHKGTQLTLEVCIECEGMTKLVCVAESVMRHYTEAHF